MDKLRALQYFVAAADQGSLAGAARQLGVSVPAVHKLMSALERELGAALFERSSRGLVLTGSGQAYLDTCRPLLSELAAADEAVGRTAVRPSGVLVVGAHAQLAHHLLLPALPGFHARCPEVQVDLRVIHRLSDDDAAPVDVFLLHGWPEAAELVHQRLGLAHSVIAASPHYWAVHGVPQHPRELARHTCLALRNPAGILIDLWEFERDDEREAVQVGGWFNSNAREAVLDLVLAGHGVGRFTAMSTQEALRSGRLVPVLADWTVQGGPPLNLLYRANVRRAPRVRLFIDFVHALVDDLQHAGTLPRVGAERPRWHRRGSARASSILRWPG
ncbi:MAG: LysR family transcriptional regulator [Rubrivivax sp.]